MPSGGALGGGGRLKCPKLGRNRPLASKWHKIEWILVNMQTEGSKSNIFWFRVVLAQGFKNAVFLGVRIAISWHFTDFGDEASPGGIFCHLLGGLQNRRFLRYVWPFRGILLILVMKAPLGAFSQPYAAICSFIQPYTAIHSDRQPYIAICSHTQPSYTVIYGHM